MEATSITLLQSAKSGSSEAWRRIDAIYRPFLRDWYRFRRIPEHFAEDLTQQVMLVLLREIPKFEHSGRAGAFRLWLRRTAVFEEKAFWKRRCNGEKASGGSEFQHTIEQLEDENNDLALHWDKQHDRFVLQKLFEIISNQFDEKTITAFHRVAVNGESVESVSKSLNMTPGAIYISKSRVIRRLRAEARGLVDNDASVDGQQEP